MLRIDQSVVNGSCKVDLSGTVDEDATFPVDLTGARELHIHCKDLLRINSVGIREFINWLKAVRERGVTIRFYNISAATVNVCNFVDGFVYRDEVVSLYLPFYCEHCNSELEQLTTVEKLKASSWAVPQVVCPQCKAEMTFDARPTQYFSFLMKAD